MTAEIDQIKREVAKLNEIIKRQSLLISKTGQSLLQLQISQQRTDVENLGTSRKKNSVQTVSDFATNDDLVQLVGELQGQLDTIEDRSIRRTVNCGKVDPNDVIAPMPNADSEILAPQDGLFPNTVKEFEELTDVKLFRIAKFYELVPPSAKEEENFEKYLEGKVENFHITDIPDEDIGKQLGDYKKDQLDDVFNDLARYLGLRSRRGTDIW